MSPVLCLVIATLLRADAPDVPTPPLLEATLAPDAPSVFAQRPFFVGGDFGLDSGVGVRAGYAPIPQIQIEAHMGTWLFVQFVGVDLRYQVLAARYPVTPTVRLGVAGAYTNFPLFRSTWALDLAAAVGVAFRADSGLVLQADVGGLAMRRTGGNNLLAPTVVATVGYAL